MPKPIHSEQYEVLRQMLIAERKAVSLTQQQLAERLKKPQSYIAKYELGERRLDVIEFLAVAHAIGFDPTKMIKKIEKGIV